jgi:hypothetical protein
MAPPRRARSGRRTAARGAQERPLALQQRPPAPRGPERPRARPRSGATARPPAAPRAARAAPATRPLRAMRPPRATRWPPGGRYHCDGVACGRAPAAGPPRRAPRAPPPPPPPSSRCSRPAGACASCCCCHADGAADPPALATLPRACGGGPSWGARRACCPARVAPQGARDLQCGIQGGDGAQQGCQAVRRPDGLVGGFKGGRGGAGQGGNDCWPPPTAGCAKCKGGGGRGARLERAGARGGCGGGGPTNFGRWAAAAGDWTNTPRWGVSPRLTCYVTRIWRGAQTLAGASRRRQAR